MSENTFKATHWKCVDGNFVLPGDKVLYLATSYSCTRYGFGTFIGVSFTPSGSFPRVRYNTKKWIWNKATETGHYEPCEIVAILKLGRIIGKQSFLANT